MTPFGIWRDSGMDWGFKRNPMDVGGIRQVYPHIPAGKSFLSRSVTLGNVIFLSGITGADLRTGKPIPGQIELQVTAALDNIKRTLEEAGSSLNHLVKHQICLKNASDSSRVWKTMLEYYQKNEPRLVEDPPVVTMTEVMALGEPEYLVEITSTAVVNPEEPGWELKKYPLVYGGVKQIYPNIQPGMPFMSEAVVVGNLVFLSALGGEDPSTGKIEVDSFEEQWKIALGKVRMAMDRAGSSLSNVINTLHFTTPINDLSSGGKDSRATYSLATDRLWKAELDYFDQHAPFLLEDFPTSTFLKVSALANPASKGQTEVTGVLSRYMPGWEVKCYPAYISRRGFPRHISEIKKQYSNALRVGRLVLIAGQTPIDVYTARVETDLFEEQALVALKNLKDVLEESGCFLENLVKTHVLIPNPANLPAYRKIELEFYQKYAPRLVEEPPATTVVHSFGLASPRFGIEVEAIAYWPMV
jgi:2-iminobutanoate/2-iminopropanoate deaminase